jgi:uncharacterized protein (TIGR03083 family)
MEITEHLAVLGREGAALGDAAESAGPDAAVPTCPEWRVGDLVRHVGEVHRWATAHVRDRRLDPADSAADPTIVGPWPSDEALIDWYREGHAALVSVLESADPALECWSFLPAPSPLAFWARRQCHETAIHRVDAESALGVVAPLDPVVAADGIDELLVGFLGRRRQREIPEPLALQLVAEDVDRTWIAVLKPDVVEVVPAVPDGRVCAVKATASDLDLLLWNRLPGSAVLVDGDPIVLETWARTVRVTWS